MSAAAELGPGGQGVGRAQRRGAGPAECPGAREPERRRRAPAALRPRVRPHRPSELRPDRPGGPAGTVSLGDSLPFITTGDEVRTESKM